MGVSENSGTPKSSILRWFSIINHPFWGTPISGWVKTQVPAAPTVVDTAVAAPAAPAPAPVPASAPAADPPVVKRFPAGSKVTIKGLTGAHS